MAVPVIQYIITDKMNSMFFLTPYKHEGLWVFDDEAVGLVREPFVLGIDTMLDRLTADIPGSENGFTLIYSPAPFPGFQAHLEWRREEYGGNWYHCPELDLNGWLCPALFQYFDEAPQQLFAKAEKKK